MYFNVFVSFKDGLFAGLLGRKQCHCVVRKPHCRAHPYSGVFGFIQSLPHLLHKCIS